MHSGDCNVRWVENWLLDLKLTDLKLIVDPTVQLR